MDAYLNETADRLRETRQKITKLRAQIVHEEQLLEYYTGILELHGVTAEGAEPSDYANMSVREALLAALGVDGPMGTELAHATINERGKEASFTTVSSELSRLKKGKKIDLKDGQWFVKKEESENGGSTLFPDSQ